GGRAGGRGGGGGGGGGGGRSADLKEGRGSAPRRARPRRATSDLSQLAPLGVDAADLSVGGVHRLRRGHLLLRDLREHLRNHELAEHLVERGVCVAGISRVRLVRLRARRAAADL